MQLIQPARGLHEPRREAVKRRLLLVDPYPRDNPYHLTAARAARRLVSQVESADYRRVHTGLVGGRTHR